MSSVMITTSADSLAAVDPRAPMATPTLAAASTGASLTPSPTISTGRSFASLTAATFCSGRAFGTHLGDAELSRDMVSGCLGITSQDHRLADTKAAESGQGGACVAA